MYEIFNPYNPKTIVTVRWEWLARLLTWRTGLDYDLSEVKVVTPATLTLVK